MKKDTLKRIIYKTLLEIFEEEESVEEVSTSAATPGYSMPYAFQGTSKKNKNKRKEIARKSGMTIIGDMDK